ncbi:MAG: hypothetical protein ACPLRM_08235 [Anaerolineae bacterium]
MKTRESCYDKVARIAYHLTQQVLPRYSHPKSPHRFTPPQLAACVLLMFYLDFSYRDMERWSLASDQVCQALELDRIPDHTTLQRTFKKLRMLDFEKMTNGFWMKMGWMRRAWPQTARASRRGKSACMTRPVADVSISAG